MRSRPSGARVPKPEPKTLTPENLQLEGLHTVDGQNPALRGSYEGALRAPFKGTPGFP